MRECILPQPTTDFDELVKWMEANVSPCTFYPKSVNGVPWAEGRNWFIIPRLNPDNGYYKIIITDYTSKVDAWYAELSLRWG